MNSRGFLWETDFCKKCQKFFGADSVEGKFSHKSQLEKNFHSKIHDIFEKELPVRENTSTGQKLQEQAEDGWRCFFDFQNFENLEETQLSKSQYVFTTELPINNDSNCSLQNHGESSEALRALEEALSCSEAEETAKEEKQYQEYLRTKLIIRSQWREHLQKLGHLEPAIEIQCKLCQKHIKIFHVHHLSRLMERHICTFHIGDRKLFQCRTCGQFYKSIEQHIKIAKHSSDYLDLRKKYGSVLKEALVNCFAFPDVKNYTVKLPQQKCCSFQKNCVPKISMKKSSPSDIQTYKEYLILKSALGIQLRKQMLETQEEGGYFVQCRVCKKTLNFAQIRNLVNLVETHVLRYHIGDMKPFQCRICGKLFKTSVNVNQHIRGMKHDSEYLDLRKEIASDLKDAMESCFGFKK